ncbi:MAG: SMEK domain-containing protein, partial [Chthoniobacteraceae bacterium]
MTFQRESLAKKMAGQLNVLADQLKTHSRASFNDASHTLEYVMARFFNALFGWSMVNLNSEKANFPAADIGDRARRIAMQITVNGTSKKIEDTRDGAVEHRLGADYDKLTVFFLLPKKPGMPKKFKQPPAGPEMDCWDLPELLEKMLSVDMAALEAAAKVLDEELGTPAPHPVANALHQLRPVKAGFVGRGPDLEKLRAQADGQAAVITGLRGMGGIGKTELALVLAHEWAARFPDAQLFVDGRGTQAAPPSGGDLLAQVIRAFHPTAKLPEDVAALPGIYADVLHGKRVLILLDNARDAAQAAPLIPPAGCALIVTSRQSFMLGKAAPHHVGRLPDAEAVALLREFHPALGDADAASLVTLCAGLPLALRLAGSHLALDAAERGGTPDVAGYLRALGGGRLAALNADAADAGEVTISETLRLSEAQLTPAQREAWRALGVFTASFDARAAEDVAAAGAEMLRLLVRRSLLEREDRDGVERYRLHDLAADYARAQLAAQSPAAFDTLRMAHARHYVTVGNDAERLYLKGDAVGGLTLFDRERAQIEAAFEWLAGALARAKVVPRFSASGSPTPHTPQPHDAARAEAQDYLPAATVLLALVNAVAHTGDLRFHPRQRIAWLEAQRDAARLTGNRQAEGNALGNLGNAHAALGDARKAIEFYEQRLVIAREFGDRRGEGAALGNLGNAYRRLGDASKSIEFHEQALVVSREIGDRRGEGNDLGSLGNAYAALGD